MQVNTCMSSDARDRDDPMPNAEDSQLIVDAGFTFR
jgi:hypothetical protein